MTAQAPDSPDVLRVAAVQMENVVGDLVGNAGRILDGMQWAESEGADVVVFPELALTGYPVMDLAQRSEFVDASLAALFALAEQSGSTPAVIGTIDRVPPRRSWDTRVRDVAISAAVVCDGELRGVYHKSLLPNYEVFNEARNFAPGTMPDRLWRIGEAVAGIAICEDAWSGDGPPDEQAAAGARILLVPNASPFHLEKPGGRQDLASQVAKRTGCPFVYVNSVGGQDELVFDGGSLVVDAKGELLYRAKQFETERFCIDVPLGPPREVTSKPTTVHSRPRPARPAEPPPPSPPLISGDEQVWCALVVGTRDFIHKNGATTAVLGLSGGIDAAVTAAIVAEALGPENVLGVAMPSPDSPHEETDLAQELARNLGIDFHVVGLGGVTAAIERGLGRLLDEEPQPGAREALDSRARATLLWAVAERLGHMPLATGNKSELSIGSAALGGDMSGAFAPLKDAPKSMVYRLARMRNERDPVIPDAIIERPSTTQEDEAHDLPDYDVLDAVVQRYLDGGQSVDQLLASGFEPAAVRGILQLVDDAEFKRRMTPPGVKVTARAFGQDLSMPMANAWRPFRADEAELVSPEAEAGPAPWVEEEVPLPEDTPLFAALEADGDAPDLSEGAAGRAAVPEQADA
jgi:NAD+ synthase (glutamine-hydrolysing)